MTTATKTAQYKGRTYRLLYIGQTKFGRRAKLGFTDGSKEFWVDAALVSESDSAPAPTYRRSYINGDTYRSRSTGNDMIFGCAACRRLGRMCPTCQHDD